MLSVLILCYKGFGLILLMLELKFGGNGFLLMGSWYCFILIDKIVVENKKKNRIVN